MLSTAFAARCSAPEPSGADAGDAYEDPPCPKGVPDAAEFSCEAGPADAGGCATPPMQCNTCDFEAGVTYPLGCKATLPIGTTYCGPLVCTCMGSTYWECPQ